MRLKRTVASARWTSLAASFATFALLCATLAYWALQLLAPAVPIAPPGSLVDHRDAPDLFAAARLFGQPGGAGATLAAAPPSNLQVLGVAASAVRGSAVLVVDGQPAKAYLVGEAVNANTRLVEVRADVAVVEQNGVRVELVAPQRPSVSLLWAGPARASSSAAARAAPPVSASAIPARPVMPPPPAIPPAAVPAAAASSEAQARVAPAPGPSAPGHIAPGQPMPDSSVPREPAPEPSSGAHAPAASSPGSEGTAQ